MLWAWTAALARGVLRKLGEIVGYSEEHLVNRQASAPARDPTDTEYVHRQYVRRLEASGEVSWRRDTKATPNTAPPHLPDLTKHH
ncbi:hypothetical protein M2284_003111 [Rhodococcus sp. LBL1]|nr:hypothetical protein [Rhodococcus sp. LBL1]MDH6684224.1 hypothetical protein [Rhodococcus sp. LBL2]